MNQSKDFFSSFKLILIVLVVTSVIFQTWDLLSVGEVIATKPLPRGELIFRTSLFNNKNKTNFLFNYSGYTYEMTFNIGINQCISFARKEKLTGNALVWYINAPQFYASTNLTPFLMAPSQDLVYFYPGHSYDSAIYPSFESRKKVMAVASLLLSNDSMLIHKTLTQMNISYLVLTRDDLKFKDSFLFSLFQGRFNEALGIINQSLILNWETQKPDFLKKIYSDENCTILRLI